jgi:hypothetical protein
MKPTLSDEQKVQRIREDVPAVQAVAYFNAGTNGPVPRASHNAMLEEAERELVEGRIAMEGFKRYLLTSVFVAKRRVDWGHEDRTDPAGLA